ncbi:MAG: type II toxin-antitoxin system RelB/DinJ family antitoxin, partial [Synergistaceae bacterium]|nr:type II toxin-antitoxin system RelB/DinJ family antitoxin [Synergistaceae bacterium]
MSTVTLEKGTFVEIEPEMLKQAEDILSRKGISYSDAVRVFTEEIILRKDVPEFKEV